MGVDDEVVSLDRLVENAENLDQRIPDGEVARTRPFDREREDTLARRNIAYGLVAMYAGVALLVMVIWFIVLAGAQNTPTSTEPVATSRDVSDLASVLLTPLVGLLGTVLGFYFASNQGENS